jgi:hypothetical protein
MTCACEPAPRKFLCECCDHDATKRYTASRRLYCAVCNPCCCEACARMRVIEGDRRATARSEAKGRRAR